LFVYFFIHTAKLQVRIIGPKCENFGKTEVTMNFGQNLLTLHSPHNFIQFNMFLWVLIFEGYLSGAW